jgi:hypothetical protein
MLRYSATIVLHDPHADVRQSGCISALKILTAARAILDLIYNVWSTSYDITLLDSFCSVLVLEIILFFWSPDVWHSSVGSSEAESSCASFRRRWMLTVKIKFQH